MRNHRKGSTLIDESTLLAAVKSTRSAITITRAESDGAPIIFCNNAFIKLTGYEESEIIGRDCRFLQGQETDHAQVAAIKEALLESKDIQLTILNYRKNGEPFWNDLIISPIKDKAGKTTHFIGLQLDVTDKISYEQRLKDSREELKDANQELEEFVYATSHDLQEPLRMVSSYMQLLRRRYADKLDDTAQEFIDFADDGAQRMQLLIQDLLVLSRVRTRAQPYERVDLNESLAMVIKALRMKIEDSGASVTVDELPQIYADSLQMTLLFQNLISNAIKYVKSGTKPVVIVSYSRQNDRHVFDVADNGIGIDKKYFSRIFEVFQRLHTRDEYEGTGVGLSIVAKIVKRHDGEVWVTSSQKGSHFHISLPVARKQDTEKVLS